MSKVIASDTHSREEFPIWVLQLIKQLGYVPERFFVFGSNDIGLNFVTKFPFHAGTTEYDFFPRSMVNWKFGK